MSSSSAHAVRKLPACPNCGTHLSWDENFCPTCGQPNHDLNISFGHLVEETLEGVFHFDSKVWRTLKELLFKPGLLTLHFVQGRRASYVPPIRLYIFISVVFFFLLNHQSHDREVTVGESEKVVAPGAKTTADTAVVDIRRGNMIGVSKNRSGIRYNFGDENDAFLTDKDMRNSPLMKRLAEGNAVSTDSLIRAQGKKPGWFNRLMVRRIARGAQATPEEVEHTMLKNVSIGMFLLMPLFGLLLKLFYRRQRPLYVQHLIFSIHLHSFFFLFFSMVLLAEYVMPESWELTPFIGMVSWAYWAAALHRFSGQGWGRTLWKSALLFGGYLLMLAFFVSAVVIISLMML